ncbi:MAG: hypothetical protein LWX09_06440 [Bacteroidia bacterium]|jgi:hypothetical protein|nr:hypothetical protein [Bacteroidia bacterium]
MNSLRRTNILSLLLALLVLAGYSGIGFSEHICYSHHQRIVSLALESEGCNHDLEETCCHEHEAVTCDSGEACCVEESASDSQQPVFQGVCCVDNYHFNSIPDEVLPVKQSLRILQIVDLFIYQHSFVCDRPVATTEVVKLNFESPPIPARKMLLIYHQMRLDPDLA